MVGCPRLEGALDLRVPTVATDRRYPHGADPWEGGPGDEALHHPVGPSAPSVEALGGGRPLGMGWTTMGWAPF